MKLAAKMNFRFPQVSVITCIVVLTRALVFHAQDPVETMF